MRSLHSRRRQPLLAASTAMQHVVLRHFGLRLTRHETKGAPRTPGHAGPPTSP